MTTFEIETLAQNQWLVWLAGGALLINSIATSLALLGVRSALRQSKIQKAVLKQQVLTAEAELIGRELAALDRKAGLQQQERAKALIERQVVIQSELQSLLDAWE